MLIRIPFSIHVEETELTRKFASRPFVPSVMAERNLRCEEILTIQAMGLKKRLAHALQRVRLSESPADWILHLRFLCPQRHLMHLEWTAVELQR